MLKRSQRFPRTRGDEPAALEVGVYTIEFSPHARG